MPKQVKKKVRFAYIHKTAAALALLCFGVIVAAGVIAEARFITIAFRAFVVILAISVLSRVIVSILASYEEMNSGEA